MTATIHTPDDPNGHPATEEEIAEFLGGMTALDGTNYLDIYRQTIKEGRE